MRRHFAAQAILISFTLCLAAAPVPAVAKDASPPPLAELTSVRWDYVSTFNGEPGVVCQGEATLPARGHETCQELVTAYYPDFGIDAVTGRVIEYIYYDGTVYKRVNDETTWTAETYPDYDSTLSFNQRLFPNYLYPWNAAITNMGRRTINGTSTTQYQFWSLDPERNRASGGQFVYDAFVSDEGIMIKDQASWRGSLPMGEGVMEDISVYRDFNTPIVVERPPAELVR